MNIFSKDFIEYIKKHPIISRIIKDLRKFAVRSWIVMVRLRRKIGSKTAAGASDLRNAIQKNSKNRWLNLALIFSVFLLLLFLVFASILFEVANRFDNGNYAVMIPKGASAAEVITILKKKNIVASQFGIKFLITFFNLENKIQAGTYNLSPSMNLLEVVHRITQGKIVPPRTVKLIIPEGTSIYKIGVLLEKQGFAFAEDFKNLTNQPIPDNLKKKYIFLNGDKNDSLEGYLFPDTYYVSENIEMYALVDLLLKRFSELVIPFWVEVQGKTKYSLHEIITLASIIEKEAVYDFERPIISSVYHNRLNINMALEADPTVKYVLENPTKRVYYKDLNVDSPYNTYKYRGLPPGPICNPGYYSIKYAIYPDETDYLYFVAKKDGTHIFSKNWQEHQKAREEANQ
ncbi:MAG: endolytic transglycosylase MltG [Candidatus Margulisbacteria bacterium]|nr:endolytic transglycosylase MltG [Candidatus Margulisiibacteriota bacterium]MBU1022600.1 endolytic transglycosylase MltG [Candidatus Margulisiibacteriota bacterium]MBU1728886.1 endolytic transglycosylase MltG [Candidatus Margulisiibacteriota bacterium]MBU1955517.1 endolytic transglycosylase MltG [Candidatus Margulisiibacteriota bacterium]